MHTNVGDGVYVGQESRRSPAEAGFEVVSYTARAEGGRGRVIRSVTSSLPCGEPRNVPCARIWAACAPRWRRRSR